jgi:tetratricopeptide (TPR) repeat protein
MAECAKLFRQSLALGPRIRRWSNAHRMLVIILLLIGITGVGGGAYAIATRDLRDVAYHRRGLDCLAEGQSELATTHFTRAIELNPDADVYWYSRGRARQAMGDINGAIDDYQASLSRRQRPEYYARMGHCYAIQKNFVLAIEFFEEAIGRGLRTSDIYNCVGRCCLMKNDNEAAISAFQSALAADERSWQAHYGLALAEMRSAKSRRVDVPDEAKSWIRRAMELGPENWRLPFMAATIYYECSRGSGRNADLAEAIRYLKKCTVLRIPRSTLASFASLPDLNLDEGFVLLLHDYQPVDPQSTPLNLLPDPVPSTE